MPQYVIDTLKPKNNNNFPVAEAVDVLYEEGSTVKDKIIAINALIVAAQQLIEGIQTDISELQSGKVDKVSGKSLSTNDFTNAYRDKVDDTYTKSETDTALAGKVDKVSGKGLSTNDFTNTYKNKVDNTYTKTETDSAIAGKIAEVVAEAPESFDTLKEIADWIDTHADSASAMNSAIQANAANIEKKVDKVEGKTLSSNDFTDVYKNKVDNTYTKTETDTALAGKVDKVSGKNLSTNDFTTAYKDKIDNTYTKSESDSITSAISARVAENESDISQLQTDVASKASISALTETNNTVATNKANLQSQIDALVLESGGDSNAEVVQARTGSDGTTYETLKERLDAMDAEIEAEVADLKESLNHEFVTVGVKEIKGETGRVELLQGDTVSLVNDGKAGYTCAILRDLEPSDVLYITAQSVDTAAYRTLGWYTSNGDGTYKSNTKDASSFENTEIKVGKKGDTLVINTYNSNKKLRVYLKKKMNDNSIARPEDFGATGDSYNDDTVAVRAAMDSLSKGGTLMLDGSKTYLISEPIVCTKNYITIDGNGATIKFYNENNLTGNSTSIRHYGMFTFLGSKNDNVYNITKISKYSTGLNYVTAETHPYALKLTVGSIVDLEAGQMIRISTGGETTGANPNHEYKAGFNILCRIVEVHSDNTVYTDYATPYDFDNVDLSNATLNVVTTIKGIRVKNINLYDAVNVQNVPPDFENSEWRTKIVAGLGFYMAERITIENVKGIGTKLPLVMVQHGYNVVSKNIQLCEPKFLDGGEGYATHYCGVLYGTVENLCAYNARHAVDFSYSAFCVARELRTASSCTNGGFDLHGICEHDITVENSNVSVQLGNRYDNFPCMVENVKFINSNLSLSAMRGYCHNVSFNNCNILAYTPLAYDVNGEECLGFNASDVTFDNCKLDLRDVNNIYIGTGIYHNPYSITFRNCTIDKNGTTDAKPKITIGDSSHECTFNFINSHLNAHGGKIELHSNNVKLSGEIVDTAIFCDSNTNVDSVAVVDMSKIKIYCTDTYNINNKLISFTSAKRYVVFVDEMVIESTTSNQISFIETESGTSYTADVFIDKLVSLNNSNISINLDDTAKVKFTKNNILTD